jgi:sec-independent protein translocase protein TatB
MFDIGFSELLLIAVVALVVIGPERLPRVARTLGHLFGRLQRYVSQVKSDINREMDLAELQRARSEFESAANAFRQDVETNASQVEREIREAQASIDRELAGASPPAGLVSEPPPAEEPEPASAAPSPQLELGLDDAFAGKPRPSGP